jgi:sortase A
VTRVVRGVGWLLLVSGAVVLLYVVYLMWFTNLGTSQAQRELAESWERTTQTQGEPADDEGDEAQQEDADPDENAVEPGDAYAMLWFERDGEPIVVDEPLYVVSGVSLDDLRAGPGHYPDTAAPGEEGNVGIAGHRTTYGAPFWSLDELTPGDTIHVVDRSGEEWVYEYVEQRIVTPQDTWVVDEDDPLGSGAPTITLTTCHPRFSAAQRLIAWGELVSA